MANERPKLEKPLQITRKPFSATQIIGFLLIAAVVVVIIVWGLISRGLAEAALKKYTEQASVPVVNVVVIGPNTNHETEFTLPGNTQPFNDAAIYARTSGYLKNWYVDIGDHVKQGQLLAEIETPELDQQLVQARADLRTAEENEKLAQTTAARWQVLLKTQSVSQQETDQYVSDRQAKKSILDAATADVHRLEELQSFEKIVAPFDGVITGRSTDIGALIAAGSGGQPKELFHISAIDNLRVFVAVPEADLAVARVGSQVGLTLDEFPGQVFTGVITRNSDSIDPLTRTLNVEIDLTNHDDQIKTGAYVLAHFKLPKENSKVGRRLLLPANTVLFRSEGLQVAVVRNNKAELVPVTIGRDFGADLEVESGLAAGDQVIVNPSDSLTSDTPVQIARPQASTNSPASNTPPKSAKETAAKGEK